MTGDDVHQPGLEGFQAEVAQVALLAIGAKGFALAAPGALVAHGLITRPTADLDLFSPTAGGPGQVSALLQAALTDAGYHVDVLVLGEHVGAVEANQPRRDRDRGHLERLGASTVDVVGAIDGFELDMPDTPANAAEFGYAGSGENRSAFPKARVVALCECGTHAFLAAEIGPIGGKGAGEKTLAQRLYPRLRGDELLTADRGFYSWAAWDTAAATGAALAWRAPTQLGLPVVRVLPDGTYLSVVMDSTVHGRRRQQILAAARAGADLAEHPDAIASNGMPVTRLVRVVEYDVPDRAGNGTGELIALITTITDPAEASAEELAAAYHQRWEQETGHDQLKTHLRGPGKVLRSRLPELVYQEIWAYLIVHHAISVLIAKASAAADLDPDRISFAQALRLIRRTATGTADIPPSCLS